MVALPHYRDNEKAYVTVNGKECWTGTLIAYQGSQVCGQSHNGWNENSIPVKCEAESVSGKLTVRVYSNLDGGADDESFAIDNVVVSQITGMVTWQRIRDSLAPAILTHLFALFCV